MAGSPGTTRPALGAPAVQAPGARRTAGLDLRPLDSAVPSARLHARAVTREWGLAAVAADTELTVAELVTNAIRAAAAITAPGGPPPVRLRLTERARGVQVEVWDACDDMPEPGPAGLHDSEGGRGLLIVAALAERHGAYRTPGGGKCTWAVLTVPPATGAHQEAADQPPHTSKGPLIP